MWRHLRNSSLVNTFAVLVVSAFPFVTAAAELEHSVVTGVHDVGIEKGSVADRVLLFNEPATVVDQGRPELPCRVVRILLPQGETVASASFESSRGLIVGANVRVALAPPAVTSDGVVVEHDVAPYDPSLRGQYLGTGSLHGYRIASFVVYPLASKGDALYLFEEIGIKISTTSASDDAVVRSRYREGFRATVEKQLASMVVNPDALGEYAFPQIRVSRQPGGFQPTTFPSLEGSDVDYVIVTNDSLAASFQVLADFKTEKGVPTVVRTTEWILNNYRNGSDPAETVRNFIIDAYQKWGIQYVLLGGDTDQVPVRLAFSAFLAPGKFLPVDMYFGCLDGDWNGDHDERFGEGAEDQADLYAEVYVGRLSAENNADANVLISKVMNYENGIDRAYGKRVLYLSEVLFPSDWSQGGTIYLDGAAVSEYVKLSSITDTSLTHVRMYENYTAYAGVVPLSKASALDSLSSGYNHVLHSGHGFRFNMSVGDFSIKNEDVAALTNSTRQSNLFLLNCTACAFTYNCLGEEYMRHPGGGAVSAIGSNESAFPNVSAEYMREYYRLLFQDNVTNIGKAFADSRLPRTYLAEAGDTGDLWAHYIYTLLGEPEMPLWTQEVDTVSVAHVGSVNLGTSPITVTVLNGGSPVNQAMVCLSKGDDDYQVVMTDGSGQAGVNFRAESSGAIKVVVTGLNIARHESEITVNAGGGNAYVSILGVTVDDDSTGGTAGNGDGMIDAGETVDLIFEVENTGDVSSGNVDLAVSGGGSAVILDDSAAVGVVATSASAVATDPVRVYFPNVFGDGDVVTFTMTVLNDDVATWQDFFKKVVHCPAISALTLRVDDTAMGNGDGVVDANETFRLYCTLKNFGTGATTPMTAAIADLDDGFVFTDSIDSYDVLSQITGAENVAGFLLKEPDVATEHRLELLVTDAYGIEFRDTLELRAPQPPDTIVIDPSHGPDRLEVSWAGADTSAVAYNIYRSTGSGGPYTLTNSDPVLHTVYLNLGLSATTRYYYVIRSVDRSGNLSAYSPEFGASTNPPQMAGFPITMSLETISSPVVGDIDGDGDLELVQGDEFLYAWHHNADEILDGDSEPLTWGVLTNRGQDYVSHVALGRVDSQPGLDIVAASRTTKEVFVFSSTGDTLAGWPQKLEHTIRAGMVVGDISGDGLNEIIAVDELGVLYVWNANGTEYRDGDSNPLTPGVFKRLPGGAFHYSTPALADLDFDGADEIIVGGEGDSLWVLNEDGTNLPGFPFYLGADISGSPAVGDIDDDGDLEIVVYDRSGTIRALHHDASVLWIRWTQTPEFFAPSPSLGDLTGDGKLETLIPSTNRKLYAFNYQGNDVPGWPVDYSTSVITQSSALIADVDGDGSVDVILGDEDRVINGWDASGNKLEGFPLTCNDAIRGVPTIVDLDQDGDVELIASSWDKNMYVWDFMGAYDAANAPWAGFHGNAHNDGLVGRYIQTAIAGVVFAVDVRPGAVELLWNIPSMGGYAFNIDRAPANARGIVVGDYRRVVSAVGAGPDGTLKFVDKGVDMGSRYVYRIESVLDKDASYTAPAVYVPVTAASLGQNYPNPFNPVTNIDYYVPEGARHEVSLVVYDVRGARVRTLVSSALAAGKYTARWDGRNDAAQPVSSGVYFYRLVRGDFHSTRKMLLIK